MAYTDTERETLIAQLIEELRGEIARDEAKAQDLFDQAALRSAHLDAIEKSLKAVVA